MAVRATVLNIAVRAGIIEKVTFGQKLKRVGYEDRWDKHSRPRAQPGQRPWGWGKRHIGGTAPTPLEQYEGRGVGTRTERKLGFLGSPCQAEGVLSLAAAQMGCVASKGSRGTAGVKESSPLPMRSSPSWGSGLRPRCPEQRSQVSQAHPGRGGGPQWGLSQAPAPKSQKGEVGKQQADRKLQFHHLITQHVCDFQVPIFVSSRSITGHK